MCTALTLNNGDLYFGRTLDLDYHYNEEILITPHKYPFRFRYEPSSVSHDGIIGTAIVVENQPLYYEAVNESGLCVAALNFPHGAEYFQCKGGLRNLASFEFIPWVLCNFKTVRDSANALNKVNIISESFSSDFKETPLHWMISDKNGSITVESTADGLKVYDNSVGILTNSPGFPFHMENLSNYLNLTASVPKNDFLPDLEISPHSNGLGAFGLPGDGSSSSRFIRASFMKFNSIKGNSESDNISSFFHIMDSVAQVKGSVRLENGKNFYTVYTSCCNVDKRIYYYTTYENRSITAIDMNKCDLDSEVLIHFPMSHKPNIMYI